MSATRQKSRKNFCLCTIALCFLLWLAITNQVSADPSPSPTSTDTLQQMQEQINQQRSNVIKERDRLSDIEQAAQAYLKGIQLNIQTTDTAYKDYDAQIQLANQRLKELQVDLAQAEQIYSQKQAATTARLRFLQRQKLAGFGWYILLKSQNLNDLLDRRHQVKLVYQADQKILIGLKAESDRINQQKTQIEVQKNQIALLTQQLLAQKAQFEAQFKAQQQLISRLTSDKKALEAAQEQLALDSKTISVLIQRQIAAASTGVFGTGQLVYPCDAEITSSFGWRFHPLLGYSRFHDGVDFGATYGSTIRAADSGTVIFAGWYGGYGNAVVINHGGGITTLYGHSSQLYVSEGTTVQRGEAIATVGSTGLSTGPHLHFEVRKDGAPVDPMAFL